MQAAINSPAAGRGKKYDFIITGAGCAGLSLLLHLLASGRFGDKRILLVDRSEKKQNDRTWCFWESGPGFFDSIVYRQWEKTWFHGKDYSRLLTLAPYHYKLIRGIDFYRFCFDIIGKNPQVDIIYGEVQGLGSDEQLASAIINGENYQADYIFNSILFEKPRLQKKDHYLLQHFKGYVIETAGPVFNPAEPTLMDFRVDQRHGTSFVYVMPFNPRQALVEYTLFTRELLEPAAYDRGLKDYLQQFLQLPAWEVKEEEFGIIPMTNHRFPAANKRVIHIGTAGGQTKASSGYTFRYIQKHSAAIVERLLAGKTPVARISPRRFHFYDSVLLHILAENKLPGQSVFSDLFRENNPVSLLRFLDNESTLREEWQIISSLPAWPFLKAALRQL